MTDDICRFNKEEEGKRARRGERSEEEEREKEGRKKSEERSKVGKHRETCRGREPWTVLRLHWLSGQVKKDNTNDNRIFADD
ncbi:hypothetical protein PAMP_002913 [Pampus punctatissimus]